MTQIAESPARAGGLRTQRALLDALDPEDVHRTELRAHGVGEARIAALYPIDIAALVEAFRDLTGIESAKAYLTTLLNERQFEIAVACLPRSLASATKLKLADLGQDDAAKWAGAFATVTKSFHAGRLTYQFAHLLAFAHAVAFADSLEPEITMALPNAEPEQEHYDSAWLMITKWVAEAEGVAQQLVRIVREEAPCPA